MPSRRKPGNCSSASTVTSSSTPLTLSTLTSLSHELSQRSMDSQSFAAVAFKDGIARVLSTLTERSRHLAGGYSGEDG